MLCGGRQTVGATTKRCGRIPLAVPVADVFAFQAISLADAATHALVAALIVAVGLVVFAANPRRPWNQLLAMFLLLVGGNYAFNAMWKWAGIPGAGAEFLVAVPWDRLAYLCVILDPAVLAYFASVFPRRSWLADRPWGPLVLFGPALVLLILEVDHAAVSQPGQFYDPVRVVFAAYLGLAYAYAGFRILLNYLHEPSSVMASQLRLVTLGVLVAVLPRVALTVQDVNNGPPDLPFHVFSLVFRFGVLASAFGACWVLSERQSSTPLRREEARRMLRLVAAAFGMFAALWTADEVIRLTATAGTPVPADVIALSTYIHHGLAYPIRWVVFSAAVASGVLRFEALAVDHARLRQALAMVLLLVTMPLVGFTGLAAGVWVGALVASAVAVAAVMVAGHDGIREAGATPGYLRQRSLEVYQATLARHLAEGATSHGLRRVEQLRSRLGVTTREHEVLLALADAEDAGCRERRTFLGRYEVLRPLGAGGTATVYLVADRRSGDLAVLKHVRRDWAAGAAAFDVAMHEFEVAQRVSHPNLVAIHDVVRVADGAVVVMEYLGGGSLREVLERDGPFSPAVAARMIEDVLAGLTALHDVGLAHGDLKPENVLLDSTGRAKVADFGAVRRIGGHGTLARASLRLDWAGTLGYLAPEQALGALATSRSDVFAAGALAWEMLTGQPYMARAPVPERLRNPAGSPPPGLTGVAGWDPWLTQALAPNPAARFPNARSMAKASGGLLASAATKGRSR